MKLMLSAAAAALVLAPSAGLANCLAPETSGPCILVLDEPAPGAKFLRVEPASPAYALGDAFPVYEHSMLIDPPRYGLPPVSGNWRYYRAEGHTYKVDAQNFAVMEVVSEGHAALLN